MRRLKTMMCLGILLMLLATTVGGCKVEEKNDAKVSDMKFTVISEKELPDELKKIIEEKKQKEMKLTYMSGDKLYIYIRLTIQFISTRS